LCIWYVFVAGDRCNGGSGRDVSNVSYLGPPGVLPRPGLLGLLGLGGLAKRKVKADDNYDTTAQRR